jgi:hypothetical protein
MENLIDLDFAPGIRASDINSNFNLIHDWLERERLRTAGWGLVEGFEMSANLNDFTVTVSAGIMINRKGEEVHVPGHTFNVGSPITVATVEDVVVPEDGHIILKHRPYSPKLRGYMTYNPPRDINYPDPNEFKIEDVVTGMVIPVSQVVGSDVFVNIDAWKGHEVTISYLSTENRIDSIMLNLDGEYMYEKSIISTSPSHVDLSDYVNTFTIGIVYWDIQESIRVQFFDEHRTFRKIYVDQNNKLYLNGKLYKDAQMIYFEKPESPMMHDLWYDEMNNVLMIWKEKDGIVGWFTVNDQSSMPVREIKMWKPEENPLDLQTFLFADNEVNYRYVPNTNAVTVIVDNTPLMNDQFSEVLMPCYKDYMSTGIGIKLAEPLDHAAHVQVVVTHRVRSSPLTETFQRAAIFISEGADYYDISNSRKIFTTKSEFVIGEDQLEIFVNGKRLEEHKDFVELNRQQQDATENDRDYMSRYFRIIAALNSGDRVVHKISKHVWSYDQLDRLLKETQMDVEEALKECKLLRQDLTQTNADFSNQFDGLCTEIDDIKAGISNTGDFLHKNDVLTAANLNDDIRKRLIGSRIEELMPTTAIVAIKNCTPNDFFQVHYVSETVNRILIRDTEYAAQTEGINMLISLQANLISKGASIYVTGFRLGA